MRLGYLYFPRFPVQRRVLEQPSLSGKPLVLHVDEKGSQRVRFASGAALKRNIKPGMTVASASALEPTTARLRFELAHEHKALSTVGELLLPLAPGFQVDAPEGLWLDASGAHLCGSEAQWAERVLKAARAVGLRGRCVVGSERFTSQAVARWCSDTLVVLPERGGHRIAELPLIALEEGWLGEGAVAPFRALGLSALGELAGLPSGALVGRFGTMGLQAARLSRGEDDSLFVADALPEVLEEEVQLDWPADALEPVLFALKMLIDRLCGRLQGRQQAAVRLTVTVGLENGEPMIVPLMLARASSERRLLVELIRHRMTDLTVNQPITTLHVRVDESSADGGRQLVLGDAPAGEVELEVVLSRLQSALGEEALFSAEPVATHQPEHAWSSGPISLRDAPSAPPAKTVPLGEVTGQVAMAPSSPMVPMGRWPKRKAKSEQHGAVSEWTLEARPPRLFKSPSLLDAELDEGGTMLHVTLAGQRRKVESLHGPERLAGAWWSNDSYSRDYYRLHLEGVGQLWVFRDARDGSFYAQGVFD